MLWAWGKAYSKPSKDLTKNNNNSDIQVLVKVVQCMGVFRVIYQVAMILMVVEIMVKIKKKIHYDEIKINATWKRIIAVAVPLSGLPIIFVLVSRRQTVNFITRILFELLVTFFIALTWIYMIVRVKRNQLAPAASTENHSKNRYSHNIIRYNSTGVQINQSSVAVIPDNHGQLTMSRTTRLMRFYPWAFSVPSLILLTYIPFALTPLIVLGSMGRNLDGTARFTVMMLIALGYICDALIYCYRTPRVRRRLRRRFIRL